jgi:hypothetical protein
MDLFPDYTLHGCFNSIIFNEVYYLLVGLEPLVR